MKSKLFEVKARAWVVTFAILITYHLSLVTSTAQTFTQRVQQHVTGEGIVTIHHDKAIDILVNGDMNTSSKSSTTAKPRTKQEKPATKNSKDTGKNTSKDTGKNTSKESNATNTASNSVSPDTTATASRHTYKTTGFRVQAFAGGNTRNDRQKAEQAGNAMRQLFPGTDVYVRFYSPRWVCRVGNYRSYEEAREVLQSIRKQGYESATIVKGKIVVSQ